MMKPKDDDPPTALARSFLDLWQDQVSALLNDPSLNDPLLAETRAHALFSRWMASFAEGLGQFPAPGGVNFGDGKPPVDVKPGGVEPPMDVKNVGVEPPVDGKNVNVKNVNVRNSVSTMNTPARGLGYEEFLRTFQESIQAFGSTTSTSTSRPNVRNVDDLHARLDDFEKRLARLERPVRGSKTARRTGKDT